MNRRAALKTISFLGAGMLSLPISSFSSQKLELPPCQKRFFEAYKRYKKIMLLWPDEDIWPFVWDLEKGLHSDFIDMQEFKSSMRETADCSFLCEGMHDHFVNSFEESERVTVFVSKRKEYTDPIYQPIKRLTDYCFEVVSDEWWVESGRDDDGRWWETYTNPKQKFKGFIL